MIQPIGISLQNWAASLVQDFPDDNVPILYNEDDWRSWGDTVCALTRFLEEDCPQPQGFQDWESWADGVYQAMIDIGV